MKVSEFEDFDQLETEGLLTGSRERSWIWFGLVVSLAIHFALCAYFYRTRFASTEALFAPSEQTPTFKVRSITDSRSEEHTSELQSHSDLVCRLLLEKKKTIIRTRTIT